MAARLMHRLAQVPEVARVAVVIEDQVAVELLQFHQPNTSRALCRARTSAAMSAALL